MFKRRIVLPQTPRRSFFLWGPRQTGKTTLLKTLYPRARRLDLLRSDDLMRFLQRPGAFREEVRGLPKNQLIVVDEVQKAPGLLDEIQSLIEDEGRVFALCGSSARQLRRNHANLLGGRALRHELFGLVSAEIGPDFDLERWTNVGPLPSHYTHEDPESAIRSYVTDYLREEVMQEGLVRRLPIFSDFLRIAAIGDTEVVNLSNIARECGVSSVTVRDHFGILEDTLMGAFLPAFVRRAKRRIRQGPKFYFRDVGVVNHLARRGPVRPGSEAFGKAFENWVFHELSAHRSYQGGYFDLSYWRLTTGAEVDFVLGDASVAIEAKGKTRVTSDDLKGLRVFREEHPDVKTLLVVSLEPHTRKLDDGIWVFPFREFAQKLWKDEWNVTRGQLSS